MRILSSLLVGALALGVSATANGAIITLSTLSSDATDPSELDATLDFSVAVGVLTLMVTNETSAPNTFNINELYFNGAGGVTGLTPLVLPAGWSLSFNQNAAIFGEFEFALTGPVDDDPDAIMPAETVTFTFTIIGVGVDTDFTTEVGTHPPGDLDSPVVAKFVFGPADPKGGGGPDSAYGGVPEPGVLALLAIAGLVGARRRRRSTA